MAALVDGVQLHSRMTARIALLTSGGDTPGMNTAISTVCDLVEDCRGTVLGVRWGFEGLARGDVREIDAREAREYASEAGTWLGTSRWRGLLDPEGQARCWRTMRNLRADGLLVLGGDGSLLGAQLLAERFSPVAFVPCTIDNDIPGTAATIGADSAISYAIDVIDRLRCTGRSLPGRGFVVQTLGAPHGRLATAVAQAAGVADTLVPKHSDELERVAEHLGALAASGAAIAVMCESVSDGVTVAAELARLSGVRVHPTILGHAQRAATPTALDRRLAQNAAQAAVEQVLCSKSSFITFDEHGVVAPVPLSAPVAHAVVGATSGSSQESA